MMSFIFTNQASQHGLSVFPSFPLSVFLSFFRLSVFSFCYISVLGHLRLLEVDSDLSIMRSRLQCYMWMRLDGIGLDGVGWGWMGLDGIEWDWMGMDGMGLDGIGWDGYQRS